jgi:outer membrane lipoprotein SlyB
MLEARNLPIVVISLGLAGCAIAPPTGPNIVAMPGTGKSFEAFQADDNSCRQYASAQIGDASPSEAASQSAVGSAAAGTVIGGAAGAALGAAAGNPAAGAAIGAGSGLLVGGATGLSAAQTSSYSLQRRYDIGYAQCMTARGENVQPPPTYAYAGYSYPYSYPYGPPYYGNYYPPYYSSFGLGLGFGFHGGHGGHGFHGGHGGHHH